MHTMMGRRPFKARGKPRNSVPRSPCTCARDKNLHTPSAPGLGLPSQNVLKVYLYHEPLCYV